MRQDREGKTSHLLRCGAVAIAYLALAAVGNSLALPSNPIAGIWLPAGLSLAAVLRFGVGIWPAIMVAATLDALHYMGGGTPDAMGWPTRLGASLVVGTGATLQALLGAWMVRRRGFRPQLARVEDVFSLLVLGGLVACTVNASLGTAMLTWAGSEAAADWQQNWLNWWLSDTVGVMTIAPLCFLFSLPQHRLEDTSLAERALWGVGMVAVATINVEPGAPLPFLFVPLLVWAPLRLGPRVTVTALATLAVFAVFATHFGMGPFVKPTRMESLLLLHRFLASICLPTLVLMAALSSRQRIEDELRAASSLLGSVVDNIPDLVFLKEAPSLRYALVNRALTQIAQRPRELWLGRSDADLFQAPEVEAWQATDRQTLENRQLVELPQETWQTPTGARHFRTKKVPVLDANGHVTHLLGISSDITELKAAEAHIQALNAQLAAQVEHLRTANMRLRELDTLKSNFVSSVSHELRTPLTSIKGYAEFLEDGLAGALTPEQQAFLSQIQSSTTRLERLVDDLLDFARMDAGTFSLRLDTVDLRHTLARAAESLQPLIGEARLSLETQAPDTPLLVRMDAQRIEQVLINLLNNAVKFTPPGGKIRIELRQENTQARCEVSDTGPGVAEADLPRLFRRFSQIDGRGIGTGLGLSISQALVVAHGGEMGVRSELGQGSTFWFNLPLAGPSLPPEPSPHGGDA
ncbi:MAG: MASE1 domain-containing protein [Candidatus Sericytochromatia bacterium]|nr:MASE1 domain-containing protein [Candidatus Sericytochromatia bacterium]